MEILLIALVLAITFGACYLIDKGFHKIFRNTQQHQSGKSVHLNKKYGAAGIVLTALGIAAVISGISGSKVLLVGGGIVLAMGIAFIVYYMTFGVYYDKDTFLMSTFGKKKKVYHYKDIQSQQLFKTAGGIVIDLYLADGNSLSLQATMEGVYDFLDWAFHGWCRQNMIDSETCEFHKPEESCWFPPQEVR